MRRYETHYESMLDELLTNLLLASESRGKDATGVCRIGENEVENLRLSMRAKKFVKSKAYKQFLRDTSELYRNEGRIVLLGHTRLATHGLSQLISHHQPLIIGDVILSHNGLVVNEEEVAESLGLENERRYESDTELLATAINGKNNSGESIESIITSLLSKIEGENNLLLSFESYDGIVGYTNTGSLCYRVSGAGDCVISGSEKSYLVNKVVNEFFGNDGGIVKELQPRNIMFLDPYSGDDRPAVQVYENFSKLDGMRFKARREKRRVSGNVERKIEARENIKRCTKCLLPETMPYIRFDDGGVCNYCHAYTEVTSKGEDELLKLLEKSRGKGDSPDCIVALSGGRDSCYGLHLLKNKYGMNPIAFTYDWGVVTPLARRNQARMCEKLGVEHIWISADFRAKRLNIRKNINAWLRKPELGMVPLFMAGDKEFFVHANRLKTELGIDLMVFAMSPLERTDFKSGFASVEPYRGSGWHYRMDIWKKIRLACYYLKQVAMNPRYLNLSVLDSIRGFIAYYLIRQDYLYLFEYADWDENTINETLIGEYGWETRPDYTSTWRIGDGTAPFYNYIYSELAGLTENDTLRSNQIRENKINREEALRLLHVENRPRWKEIQEYCNLIGVDIDNVINSIEGARCLYLPEDIQK